MGITRKSLLLALVLLTLLGTTLAVAQTDMPGPGWTAGLQIQNTGDATSDISLTTYDADGVAFDCKFYRVNPGLAANFQMHTDCPVATGYVGSAVITGEAAMVGIINVNNVGVGKAAGQYRATESAEASPTLAFPLVKHNHSGRTTTFFVQNTGDAPATINYTFAMQTGQTVNGTVINIPAYAMTIISPADAGIPAGNGQVGSLTVTGDQPLAGVSLEHEHAAAVHQNLQASRAFTPASYATTVYCPLFRNGHTNRLQTTGAQAQNVSDQTQTITLTYVPAGGGPPLTFSKTAGPGESATFYAPQLGIPVNSFGAVTIRGEANIVAIVNEAGLDGSARRTATYNCFPKDAISYRVNLPLVKELFGGQTSGIQVQNVGRAPATITLTYLPRRGAQPVVLQNATPTAVGAAFTAWSVSQPSAAASLITISGDRTALANNNMSVMIESNQQILVIVNESSYNPRVSDVDSKIYEGFNE